MKGRRSVLPKREKAEPPADIPLDPILQAQQLQGDPDHLFRDPPDPLEPRKTDTLTAAVPSAEDHRDNPTDTGLPDSF